MFVGCQKNTQAVLPAKAALGWGRAGIQVSEEFWIPAFAGKRDEVLFGQTKFAFQEKPTLTSGEVYLNGSSGVCVANPANANSVQCLGDCTAEALRAPRKSVEEIILNKPSANSASLW